MELTPEQLKKIRLSYTFLETWRRGKIAEALDMYYHRNTFQPTPQMIAGKELHEKMEAHIKEHKQFPEWVSTTLKLKDPISEQVYIVDYNDKFLLKGVIDVSDNGVVYELKTGLADSLKYTKEYQVPLYFLLCELVGIEVDRAIIIHHNQYTQKNDVAMVWNGKRQIERARNYIDSIGSDVLSYFESEKLW